MTTRKVITRRYKNELHKIFGADALKESGAFLFHMDEGSLEEKAFALKLTEAAQQAVLISNSAICNCERLRHAIGKIIFRDSSEAISNDILDIYMRSSSNEIDLDGFVYFVMNNYSEKINVILYRMVRDGLRAYL